MIAVAIIALMLGGALGYFTCALFIGSYRDDPWDMHEGSCYPFGQYNPYVSVVLQNGNQCEGRAMEFEWEWSIGHMHDTRVNVRKYKVIYA